MKRTDEKNGFKALDKSLKIQKIIDTATELFHKKGYRSTTLHDVAEDLGITKAALYHYVSSKENLLSIIYIQALESIFRNTYRISEMDLPPDEKMKLILRNHIKNIIIDSLSMFSVFFTEENQLPENDFKKIRDEKRKYNLILEGIIKEGISQGLFRDADPRLQANAIIGMCNWVYKWYRPGSGSYTPDQVADNFVALLEKGYLNSEAGKNHGAGRSKAERAGGIRERLQERCREMIKLLDEI